MTIDKAIEILRLDIDIPGSVVIEEVNAAEELGIEALKEVNALRKVLTGLGNSLLPGETKE